MKLSWLELTNFRCFERLRLDPAPDLTVLVGNNGAGKTAILDAAAYALSPLLARMRIKGKKNLRAEDIRVVRKEVQAPYVRVAAETTKGVRWDRTLRRDWTRQTAADVPEPIGDKALYEWLDPTVRATKLGESATLPIFAYYGVSRAVLEIPARRRNFPSEFCRLDALDNALEPTTRFRDLFAWFYAQERNELAAIFDEFSGGQEPGVGKLRRRLPVLQAVREAIVSIIPGFSRPRIRADPLRLALTQRTPDGSERELSLQMLSDGYRTMVALVMDFARRLAQANPHLDKPLEAEAILMVDEVDLHLHPVWQQTVVPSFRRAFPNTQFIFSTHSPQVLTTVEAEKILIVDTSGVRPCPAPTYGARSSDVVAEVLGLQSLRPPDNEIASNITALFQALDAGHLDEAKRLRAELESWAKGFPEPDLTRADLLIRRLEHQQKQLVPAP